MTNLRVLLHVAAQRDYELHSLEFSTTFLQGSLHEEIRLRCPPGFTGSFPAGTQWSLRKPVYGFRQAPCEWHDTLSLFLRTDTSLLLFYVLVYVDDLVFAIADTEALTLGKSEPQKRHTCTDLGPLALRLPVLLATAHSSVYRPLALSSTFRRVRRAEWSDPELVGCLMHRKVHWDAAKRVLRHLCSTSGMGLMLGGRGPVVLSGHADASWEAERPSQLLAQVNYVALVKQGGLPGQRGQSSGGGSSGWKPTKDVDKKKSAKNSGRGGGSRRRECWLCGDPNHLSFECPDCSRNQLRREKQSTRSSTSAKDADSSAGGKGRDNKEASCSLVGVVELTVSLVLEAGEDFQAMAAAVQANPADVQGRSTVGLQGEAGRASEPAFGWSVEGERREAAGGRRRDVARLGGGKRPRSGDLHRASPLHRPASMLGEVDNAHDGGRGPADDRLSNKVDAGQAAFAHVGMNTIRSSAKHEVATGLDLNLAYGADLPSGSCVGGKLARHTFPDQGSDADDVLAVVHVDLCRPFRVAAKDGSLYFLLLKDRKTRYVWVRPVTKKSDVLQEFVQGLAVCNCLERSTLQPGTTPYQLLIGKKPNLLLARVWGCMAQFLVLEQQRGGKLKPKARWGLHLGVSEESKGWELLDIADNRVVTTSDAVFYENMSLEVWNEPAVEDVEDVPSPSPSPAPRAPPLVADQRWLTLVSASCDEGRSGALCVAPAKSIAGGRHDVQQVDVRVKSTPPGEEQAEEVHPTVVKSAKGAGEQAAAKPTKMQSATRQSAEEPTTREKLARKPAEREPRQSGRIQRPPDFYVPAAFTTVYNEVNDDLHYDDIKEDEDFPELDPDMHADPKHRWDISTMMVKEALASWKGKAVKAAMEEEICSLVGMGTRELGFTQVYGTNYNETYASLSNYVTQRIFLSIVAVLDLNLMQLDMKNAFLQSKLDRVLYMYQSDYFNDGTGRKKSQFDTALYFKVGDDKVTWWVLVYVDDLFAPSSSAAMLKELLKAAFELWEISPVQKYLGLEIVRDMSVRKLWPHQQGYADKLRRRFLDEEQNGCTLKTPVLVDAYATLTFDDEEAQVREEEEYRRKVGSLQFAATTTRPDIAFACSKLRSDQHWHEVDRCLAYLANTRDTALEFGGGAESLKLVGYVDADDAGDKQNRMSTGGYVFVFGGAAVSWSSQCIKCATLSSTESEYVAATEAGNEGRRLRFLLAQFRQLDVGTPTVLRVDNKSAITVAEGMGLSGNLKHMERRQAWLQHMVKRGKFSLRYIPTAEQSADFLTNALHYPAFNRCSIAIGQVRLVDVGDGDNDVQQ
ncbi:unnamed protein product [Closterium sp. NIES-53]